MYNGTRRNEFMAKLSAGLLATSAKAGRKESLQNILSIMSVDYTSQAIIGTYDSRLAVLNPTPVIDTSDTSPGWKLYDLKKDPQEMNNVYDNPEYAQNVVQLKADLKKRWVEYGENNLQYPCNRVIAEFWDDTPEKRKRAVEISHQMLESIKNGTWPYNRHRKKLGRNEKKKQGAML